MESKFETLKVLHAEAIANYEIAMAEGNQEVAEYFHEMATAFFKMARKYQ